MAKVKKYYVRSREGKKEIYAINMAHAAKKMGIKFSEMTLVSKGFYDHYNEETGEVVLIKSAWPEIKTTKGTVFGR